MVATLALTLVGLTCTVTGRTRSVGTIVPQSKLISYLNPLLCVLFERRENWYTERERIGKVEQWGWVTTQLLHQEALDLPLWKLADQLQNHKNKNTLSSHSFLHLFWQESLYVVYIPAFCKSDEPERGYPIYRNITNAKAPKAPPQSGAPRSLVVALLLLLPSRKTLLSRRDDGNSFYLAKRAMQRLLWLVRMWWWLPWVLHR